MGDALPPFQRFLDEHRDPVYRFLLAFAGPSEAEDCFQETFLAALRAYPRLRDASNLRGWVLTIARRKALDAARRRRRADPVAEVPDAVDQAPEADDGQVWGLVSGLPPRQREAITLRYAADLAYREIAALMACSEPAARQSVRLGLARLRKEWRG
ncbi:MAG TPA: sigma-70 family RNA polymerase sigma factor [Actinomycetota bacterium]|nr:sigma-70 family RNA polymerase sigma factor [Actinomycetota bacterium]